MSKAQRFAALLHAGTLTHQRDVYVSAWGWHEPIASISHLDATRGWAATT